MSNKEGRLPQWVPAGTACLFPGFPIFLARPELPGLSSSRASRGSDPPLAYTQIPYHPPSSALIRSVHRTNWIAGRIALVHSRGIPGPIRFPVFQGYAMLDPRCLAGLQVLRRALTDCWCTQPGWRKRRGLSESRFLFGKVGEILPAGRHPREEGSRGAWGEETKGVAGVLQLGSPRLRGATPNLTRGYSGDFIEVRQVSGQRADFQGGCCERFHKSPQPSPFHRPHFFSSSNSSREVMTGP